jgi:integral membrane protein
VNAALTRYKVMAYLVGTGLLVLTLVGVPLQYAANKPAVVAIVGPIHGLLYIIYLASAYDLARRARFTLLQLAAMVAAGLLPFLAFVLERRVVKRVHAEQASGNLTGPRLFPHVSLSSRAERSASGVDHPDGPSSAGR